MINNKSNFQGLIRVLTGEYRSAEIKIRPEETISIGRAVDNDLIFENQKSISRNHCAITWYADENMFGVVDTSSSGTRREDTGKLLPKNDKSLRLMPGTVISIGGTDNQLLLTMRDADIDPDDEDWAGFYPGMVIEGRYVVESTIVKETDARIYCCFDKTLGTHVSIKTFADDGQARLEAKKLARFRESKDVVNVYGLIKHGQKSYIVMEYIEWEVFGNLIQKWKSIGRGDAFREKRIVDGILTAVERVRSEGINEGFLSLSDIYVSPDMREPEIKIYIRVKNNDQCIWIGMSSEEMSDSLYGLITGENHRKTKGKLDKIKAWIMPK